ncbi:MAG: DUF721 domain-containing protein [Barnesiella sp.]|nr:DUF721 domain-containing protein [Barnesiella sp.]MBD5344913.1 DUF721 domain-containing protein [Bacteroides sp.]MDE5828358.1 DUF721 domain-containing protein [Duncaniella sp.]
MKRTDPVRLGDFVDRVLAQAGISDRLDEHRLCSLWPEIVGPGINRYTVRRYVDRGVLHVYLTSAPLKNELMFNRAALVKALNDACGREVITDVSIH